MLALYGTAALVLALDQLTKHLVVTNLAGRPPVDLLDDVVQLRYTTNSGGAFSLLTGAPLFFGIMAIVIVGGIIYASAAPSRCRCWSSSASSSAGPSGT